MHVALLSAKPLPYNLAQWLLETGLEKRQGSPTVLQLAIMYDDEYLMELGKPKDNEHHGGYVYICKEGAIRISAGCNLSITEFSEISSISDIRLAFGKAMKKQKKQEQLYDLVSNPPVTSGIIVFCALSVMAACAAFFPQALR